MKLEETDIIKLQYIKHIQTTTSQISNSHDSDTELAEKIIQILNIYEKKQKFKGKPSFKKWCNYCHRYGHTIAEFRQKQQDNQNKLQEHRKPNESFYQYRKKDQNLPKKNIHRSRNHFLITKVSLENNHPKDITIVEDLQTKKIHEIFHKIDIVDQTVKNNQYRNNYSRSQSHRSNYSNYNRNCSNSNPQNRFYSNDCSRNSSYKRNTNYSNNRNRQYQNNRSRNYSNSRSNFNKYHNRLRDNSQNRNSNYPNRQRNFFNHHTEKTHNIRIQNKTIQVVHLNIKDK